MLSTVDELSVAVADEVRVARADVEQAVTRMDGFGSTDVDVLEVSAPDGGFVRVWQEGGRGDYLFEIGPEELFAAWWGQRRERQARLPQIVLALALNRFEEDGGRITVRVGAERIALRTRM
jgi:hypothetical protein